MLKPLQHKKLLIQAVFASTLFATHAQANTLIASTVTTTQVTNGADNNTLEITPSGQVNVAAMDGVDLNSVAAPGVTTGGTLIIDPMNQHGGNAISLSSGTGVHFIASPVLGGGVLTIGVGSGISAAPLGTAVVVDNTDGVINNAGTITAFEGAIQITQNGTNTIINNALTGTILSGDVASTITTEALAPSSTLTLNNSGLISQTFESDTIQINSLFSSINNNANGVIKQTGTNGANAIDILAGGGGNINNNLGGQIIANSGSAVAVHAPIGTINNAGTMISNTTANVITLGSNATQIINSGTMQAANPTNAVIFATGASPITITNGIVNSGDVINQTLGGSAIDLNTSATVAAAVVQNGGTIQGNVLLAKTDGAGGPNVFTMTGGNIAGTVGGFAAVDNNFTISGGTISGSLIAGTIGGISDIFNLSGGSIGGILYVNLLGTNTVNLSGTALNQLQSDSGLDVINITGGSFNLLLGSTGIDAKTSIVNIQDTFTANGTITNFTTINIQNPGTVFTANDPIVNVLSLTIDDKTEFVPNNSVQFNSTYESLGGPASGISQLINFGLLSIQQNPIFDFTKAVNLSGIINQSFADILLSPTSTMTVLSPLGSNGFEILNVLANSTITPQIFGPLGGPATMGQMVVDSTLSNAVAVNLALGSFIQPLFQGFIPQDQSFPLITLNTGTNARIFDGSSIEQYPSAVVTFSKSLNATNNILTLTAHRKSYLSLSSSDITPGVAATLDFFAQGAGPTNNDFYTLLSQLDQIPTRAQLDSAMDSLVPPYNYGLIAGSHIGMESVFEAVTDRVWDVAWHHPEHGRRHTPPLPRRGMNYGDYKLGTTTGVWLRPVGAYLDQSERNDAEGYRAQAYGGALGADWGITDCTTLGLALSYTHVNVADKDDFPKDEAIESWQGTLYGSFDMPHGFFMDAMFGLATNQYHINRVIAANFLKTAAQASFNGTQWAAQADLGQALPGFDFFLAPFVRLRYVHLEIDDYTEGGASDLSLHVQNQDADEFLTGVGVRLASDFQYSGLEWVPELTLMLAYDFHNDGEQTLADFVGGGPAFTTDGVTPSPTIFDLGIALNAMCPKNYVFTAKYNLEIRDKFVGNSAYLQFFYNWS